MGATSDGKQPETHIKAGSMFDPKVSIFKDQTTLNMASPYDSSSAISQQQ